MNISKIEVGELQCNCYLLEKDNNCLIIDPGAEYSKIKNYNQLQWWNDVANKLWQN